MLSFTAMSQCNERLETPNLQSKMDVLLRKNDIVTSWLGEHCLIVVDAWDPPEIFTDRAALARRVRYTESAIRTLAARLRNVKDEMSPVVTEESEGGLCHCYSAES